jgi:hypothetical protein
VARKENPLRDSPQKAMHEELMEQVVSQANAMEAWRAVKRNGGSPGIDGMTTGQLRDHIRAHWESICGKLLAGTYGPSPVKRVGDSQSQWRSPATGHPDGAKCPEQLDAAKAGVLCPIGPCSGHVRTLLRSTAGCGKPHVRWCGRDSGRNPAIPTRSKASQVLPSAKGGVYLTESIPARVLSSNV